MVYALLVAGGSGSRMKSDLPKQFLELTKGRTILQATADLFFQAFPQNFRMIIVLPEDYHALGKSLFVGHPREAELCWAKGGATRFDSVKNGLALINGPGLVFIHDAVRPCITVEFLHQLMREAKEYGHIIPCTEVKESLRVFHGEDSHAVDRSLYRAVQTPQVFDVALIRKAYEQTYSPHFTDDASVAEANGLSIRVTTGLDENLKITRPADLELARILLKNRA